jgi:hypothetical protein
MNNITSISNILNRYKSAQQAVFSETDKLEKGKVLSNILPREPHKPIHFSTELRKKHFAVSKIIRSNYDSAWLANILLADKHLSANETTYEYERCISDTLVTLCESTCDHIHLIELDKNDRSGNQEVCQTIIAIDTVRRIKIIAQSFVNNRENMPYVICSVLPIYVLLDNNQTKHKIMTNKQKGKEDISKNKSVLINHL